jgi:hypothetical protein
MIRRYIYDPQQDRVVEVGEVKMFRGLAYEDVIETHKENRTEQTGAAVRQAALERSERREFAHKRYGDERRWAE